MLCCNSHAVQLGTLPLRHLAVLGLSATHGLETRTAVSPSVQLGRSSAQQSSCLLSELNYLDHCRVWLSLSPPVATTRPVVLLLGFGF